MSRSFGAGQPIWFKCPIARRTTRRLGIHTKGGRNIQLTGQRRERASNRTGALRSDSRFVYQFKCLDCGHVGWSRHIQVARRYAQEFPQKGDSKSVNSHKTNR